LWYIGSAFVDYESAALRRMNSVANFFANTWFVWWIVAVVVILRWLHVVSPQDAGDEAEEVADFENFTADQFRSSLP
jgi:hypothetical protein